MGYGWEGDRVRLVPLDKERHLENAVRWLNDPEVTQYLLVGDFPMTRLAEEEWFARAPDTGEVRFAIETLNGVHIGFSGLHRVDYRHGTAESGTLIGDPSQWGKGYGSDAARVRAKYAFEVVGLRMLTSGCLEGNERSYRMLSSVGYREYGRLPEGLWKRGRYVDHILMYLSRQAWSERPSPG